MSLNVKKCKECGSIFNYMGRDICPECIKRLDECFVAIRDYLDEHPNAKVAELSEELEIKEKTILDFIKQGRIMVREPVLNCVNCGRPICGGDLCDECRSNIGGQISKVVDSKKKEKERIETDININRTGGMHVKK